MCTFPVIGYTGIAKTKAAAGITIHPCKRLDAIISADLCVRNEVPIMRERIFFKLPGIREVCRCSYHTVNYGKKVQISGYGHCCQFVHDLYPYGSCSLMNR